MDHYTVKCFFKGLCFIACIGGAASRPPTISGISSSTVLSFDETNTINFTLFTFTVTDENTVTIEPYDGVTRSLAVAIPNEIISQSGQSGQKRQFNVTVMTIKPLDRDQATGGQSLYQLRFNIRDLEENTVTTPNVYIQVNDVNDNAPRFKNQPYRWNIDEKPFNNSAMYLNIGAEDDDSGENSQLSFSMKPNTKSNSSKAEYNNHFNITSDTGVVHLLKELDYEENSYYQFTITVQDHGNPPKSATADLTIRVNDAQDTPPFFTVNLYRIAIDENIKNNTPVEQINALDGDLGVPNDVTYQILPDDGCSKLFNIYPNGTMFTNDSIDRDEGVLLRKYGGCILTVQVHEVNQNRFPQYGNTSAETHVTITINDLDDNFPTFNQSIYTGSIFENSGVGVAIQIHGGIYVSDKDQGDNANMNISVTFADGSPCPTFAPDPPFVSHYGEIRIIVTNNKNDTLLDNEQTKSFELLVTVSESIKATSSATAIIKVTVNDINESVPQLLNDLVFDFMNVNVSESAVIGSHVINVHAESLSGGDGNLTYRILGGNEGSRFVIDRLKGEVTILAPLDREVISSYKLIIEASNNHGSSSKVKLNINVLDANDNAPVFSQKDYGEHRVLETDVIGTRILNVAAFDVDEGTNKDITYTLEGASNLFGISRNGSIIVAGDLRDRVGLYNVTAKAIDNGVPSLTGTVMIRIIVEDVNLNNPVIGNLPDGLKIQVFDCEAVDSIIWVFNYTDNDQGINAQATFTIVEFPEPLTANNQTFKITPDGKLVLTKQLHPKIQRMYKFIVLVTDHGLPVPLSGDAPLTIYAVDAHNRLPSFASSWITMNLRENAVFETVGHVNATILDLDSSLCYSLNELTRFNWTRYFNLNKHTGELTNTMPLDYEKLKEIALSVHVDDCSMHANASCANNRSQGHNAPTSDTYVRITLEDVNDNPPVFLNHSLSVEIINGIRPGTVLDLQLKNSTYVLDQDSPINGIDAWTFENDGYVVASTLSKDKILPDSGVELCEDNFTHPFCVTSNGSIIANIAIDQSISGCVYLPIKVKDAAGEDKTNVTIFFIGTSHLASMIVRQTLASVFVIKDDPMRLYSNLTGYQFIFDKLSNHVKSNGDIVMSRSDLQYHVLHLLDGRILSHEEIKRLLESIMDELRFINMLNLYNIETSIQ